MDRGKRKPVNDIVVSGFGRVDIIGHGLARVWLFVDHIGEGGQVEHRMRKRPLVMPVDTLPHSIMMLTKAMADSMIKPGLIATVQDGDDRGGTGG